MNKMFSNLVKILLLVSQASVLWALTIPSDYTTIRNSHAYMADSGQIAARVKECIDPQFPTLSDEPQDFSMERLIEYVERLEDILANTTDDVLRRFKRPDDIARLILQRFHLDEYDITTSEFPQYLRDKLSIDDKILGKLTIVESNSDYYFPDPIYTKQELCNIFFMFSHIMLNTTASPKAKRSVYTMTRDISSRTSPRTSALRASNTRQRSHNANEIKESGVVNFRQSNDEAIAPAKVFIGIIAGLADNVQLEADQILGDKITPDLKGVKLTDAALATTLANMPGSTAFTDTDPNVDDNLVFGMRGKWIDTPCCTYYAIQNQISNFIKLAYSSRGTQAQIRGAIDGYIIGSKLAKIRQNMQNIEGWKLSSILRSYYSMPHLQAGNTDLTASYCDRQTMQTRALDDEVDVYSRIYKVQAGKAPNILNKYDVFKNPLQSSKAVQQDICQKLPTTSMSQESSCETPSDLLFVVDPKQENLNQTLTMINNIARRINKIGRYAGKISVFVNSETQSLLQLPGGNWPLTAVKFNATNIGSITCPFKRQNPNSFSPITSAGKFFKKLNQTLANYKYWSPRFFTGVPSKNLIIIDYDTLKESTDSQERQDYDYYQDSLKYRNPDVRYLVAARDSKLFEQILNKKDEDLVSDLLGSANIDRMVKRICENPATITYNQCYDKPSDKVRKDIYITPGYKQNWAVYPEFFLKSFTIVIKIKATDGGIKYCFDREFPPQRQENCKEIQMGGEESITITDPCKKQDIRSCSPFFFTFWAKERKTTSPCQDLECQSMDQVKITLQHTGMSCNSAMRLGSIFFIQIVCLFMIYFSSKGFF